MVMVMSCGYFRVMRYLVQVYPDGVGGREVAVAFDLRRAAVVHAHPPMGESQWWPIQSSNWPPPGIVIPTPVSCARGLDIRLHLGGADPEGVVQELGQVTKTSCSSFPQNSECPFWIGPSKMEPYIEAACT